MKPKRVPKNNEITKEIEKDIDKIVLYTLDRFFPYGTFRDVYFSDIVEYVTQDCLYFYYMWYDESKGALSTYIAKVARSRMSRYIDTISNDWNLFNTMSFDANVKMDNGEPSDHTLYESISKDGEEKDIFDRAQINNVVRLLILHFNKDRDQFIIRKLSEGSTFEEIGKSLGVSRQAIQCKTRTYRRFIKEKLGYEYRG